MMLSLKYLNGIPYYLLLIEFLFSFFDEIFFYWNLNKTALHIAVEKGNLEVVQLLLERKEIDVNVKAI